MRTSPTGLFLVAVLALSIAPRIASADDIGPSSGNKAAHVRGTQTLVIPFMAPGAILSELSLTKGRRGHSVPLEVTVNFFNVLSVVQLGWKVTINGVTIPPTGLVGPPCPVSTTCLQSFSWWADLDELEATNPGLFVGQPLSIVFSMSDDADAGTSTTIFYTVSARLEKR
jgi:hypothetical protein